MQDIANDGTEFEKCDICGLDMFLEDDGDPKYTIQGEDNTIDICEPCFEDKKNKKIIRKFEKDNDEKFWEY